MDRLGGLRSFPGAGEAERVDVPEDDVLEAGHTSD